jgi:hypothetical protein
MKCQKQDALRRERALVPTLKALLPPENPFARARTPVLPR